MTREHATISMRADLVRRKVWMGNVPMWVVKDPLSRAMFYFSQQEHEILNLADGTRTIGQIAAEASRRMAPNHVSAETLVRFFAEAHRNRLVTINGSAVSAVEARRPPVRRWWHHPLAIRVPGINPDRFLDFCLPWCRFLLSPAAFFVAMILIVMAAFTVARHFDTFAGHMGIAAQRYASGQGLLMLLVVVSLVKIVHEFAHAIACKRFGGECRELGLMFLVGVPCLYCDVSDAWLLERRWKRILVSAAGMLAELTLASIATLLWVFAADGPVRDLCVTVMVICSVTTILFNGNPLLRYDGYYILSDLVGIPNLASRSTAVIRGWVRRLFWGAASAPTAADTRKPFLVAYGMSSGLYRIAIYFCILLMIYRLAESRGFGNIVGAVTLAAAIAFCVRIARSVFQPPPASEHHRGLAGGRPFLLAVGMAAAAWLFAAIPLPQNVVAPMSVQPAGAHAIFVTKAGRITSSVTEGDVVRAGETLAVLTDPQVDRELEAIDARCDRLAMELDSLRQRRGTSRVAAARIPVVQRSYEEATKQRELREQVTGNLTLSAPGDGLVFAAPRKASTPSPDDRHPRFWEGTPLERVNRGAWLDEGTLLCVVGDRDKREAVVLMPQEQVALIREGQRARLLLADRGRGTVTGKVLEIAASPSRDIPVELGRPGLINPDSMTAMTPVYQVRVVLDETAGALPVRMTGIATITVSPASILMRLGRFLRQTFG